MVVLPLEDVQRNLGHYNQPQLPLYNHTIMHLPHCNSSALQGSFYHGAFPPRTLGDYEKRGYEALLQRGGKTWHVPLGRTKHMACLYQKRDYMVGFFGGPDSLRCFPGGLKKQVRFFNLALVGCCSDITWLDKADPPMLGCTSPQRCLTPPDAAYPAGAVCRITYPRRHLV